MKCCVENGRRFVACVCGGREGKGATPAITVITVMYLLCAVTFGHNHLINFAECAVAVGNEHVCTSKSSQAQPQRAEEWPVETRQQQQQSITVFCRWRWREIIIITSNGNCPPSVSLGERVLICMFNGHLYCICMQVDTNLKNNFRMHSPCGKCIAHSHPHIVRTISSAVGINEII